MEQLSKLLKQFPSDLGSLSIVLGNYLIPTPSYILSTIGLVIVLWLRHKWLMKRTEKIVELTNKYSKSPNIKLISIDKNGGITAEFYEKRKSN